MANTNFFKPGDPASSVKKLEGYFPGFTIEHHKDGEANNYFIQHQDQTIVTALSQRIAGGGPMITGASGNPKYVADHLQNGNSCIILTDNDIKNISDHATVLKRTMDLDFRVSADSLKQQTPSKKA